MKKWYYAYRVCSQHVDVSHERPILVEGPFDNRDSAKRSREASKLAGKDFVFTGLFQAESKSDADSIAKSEQFNHWAF